MGEFASRTEEMLVLLNRRVNSPSETLSEDEDEKVLIRAEDRADNHPLPSYRPVKLTGLEKNSFKGGKQTALILGNADKDLRIVLGDPSDLSTSQRLLKRSTDSFRTKLFGQDKDEPADEIIIQDSRNQVSIHPLSKFRDGWDSTTLVLVVYTVLVLPFRAAFFWDYYKELDERHNLFQQLQVDWMLSTDLLVDIFFIADVFLNFHTGIIVDQMLIMERKAVATHYLKGWFALDVLASFPLDLIFAGKRMDMWRLPRLLKVIRVLNYKSLSHALHSLGKVPLISEISRFHGQLLRLLTFLSIWVHWDACLQYGSCANPQHNKMCWVEASGLTHATIWEKYSWAVLKALSETISAGYGIQNPATATDCWMTILSLLIGICIWTYLTSILTTLLIHLNAASSEYTTKMASLNSFMAHRHLPQDLRQHIRDTYEARWKAEKHFDEEEILEELPGSLRIQVCMHTCADVIHSVPFFDDAEEGFIASLVTMLRPQVYLKDDYIVREGEVAREMYFLKSGAVQVEVRGQMVTLLKKGSYFGEIGLLRNARRSACVRAVSDTCDLFVLTKKAFDNVMHEYPDSFKAMDLVAEHRLRALHASWAWQQKEHEPACSRSTASRLERFLEMQDMQAYPHEARRRSLSSRQSEIGVGHQSHRRSSSSFFADNGRQHAHSGGPAHHWHPHQHVFEESDTLVENGGQEQFADDTGRAAAHADQKHRNEQHPHLPPERQR